jgi:hypothetical protein
MGPISTAQSDSIHSGFFRPNHTLTAFQIESAQHSTWPESLSLASVGSVEHAKFYFIYHLLSSKPDLVEFLLTGAWTLSREILHGIEPRRRWFAFLVRVEEPMLHYVLHRLNTHYGSLLDHIVHGLRRQLLVLFPQLDK